MTKNTYFISDTHFRHNNILKFENRPFKTIEEMENKMVEAWNSVVNKTDVVYLLGDFCFGNHQAWIEILNQLRGEIYLVKGNHDKTKIINRVLSEGYLKEFYEVGKLIRIDKLQFHLTHYPLEIGERPFMFNISGHIHNKPSQFINQLNAGVDSEMMHHYYNLADVPFGAPIPISFLLGVADKINETMSIKYKRGE